MNPNIFVPERGDMDSFYLAIRTCNACEVIEQCRDYGIELDKQELTPGIYGGLSQRQRRQLKRAS
jgi:hypothetical protein